MYHVLSDGGAMEMSSIVIPQCANPSVERPRPPQLRMNQYNKNINEINDGYQQLQKNVYTLIVINVDI